MHVGTDIVHIPALGAQLATPGSTFDRVFTERELRDCAAKPQRASSLAARWAAKEAYVKAWSQSLYGSPPVLAEVDFRDIEVVSDAFGRVAIALRGEVAAAGPPAQSLSVSHDGEYAVAVCVVG
ncbi:holo-[acyl-carrier protein] synthase [Corynebacterium mycetoides]|uniref:Holo-[acyl-carrier-protein] synthase n=1 Tax=Corynebacterium mycetoides TaxID=38302 RepID=A0A1G9QSD4_9CORY|nr:holo-ACP synthase [Corynebacterium mycetoides]SDM13487.1 holo-[acyl-carrier protein] synthase [Corynebacterium mycetoides]